MRSQPITGGTSLVLILFGIWMTGCASTRTQHLDRLLGNDGSTRSTALQQPPLDPKELTAALQHAVDSVRFAHNRTPLEWSEAVAAVATSHSIDMAQHLFFSHMSQSGLSPADRARVANLRTRTQMGAYVIDGLGENLFLAHLYHSYVRPRDTHAPDAIRYHWKTASELAHETIRLWMKSPLHRRNLMSTLYRSGGVGVAFGSHNTIFVTCNFSVIDSAKLAAN